MNLEGMQHPHLTLCSLYWSGKISIALPSNCKGFFLLPYVLIERVPDLKSLHT